jgi:hypothetical protein
MIALTSAGIAVPANAQSTTPWLPPTYQSPSNLSTVTPVPSAPLPHAAPVSPPLLYVPGTGRTLPNLPTLSGSGRGGRETYQDRAARCAHQAGTYGSAAGDRDTYINTCINQ